MPDPNCTIKVAVSSVNTTDARFYYWCSASSRGWQVQPDGGILPPPKERIVQFQLRPMSSGTFTGFQITANDQPFPNRDTHPFSVAANVIEVNPLEPGTVLTLDLTAATGLLKYQLAVDGQWDEPRIYDDGGE